MNSFFNCFVSWIRRTVVLVLFAAFCLPLTSQFIQASPLSALDGTVRAQAIHPLTGELYAAGSFTHADGIEVNHIARWDGMNWHALGGGLTGQNGDAYALAFDSTSGHLYVGGNFTQAGNVPVNYIAKWDGAAWSDLDLDPTSTVYALAFDSTSGYLYVGGSFFTILINGGSSSELVNHLVKWDANLNQWLNIGGVDGSVYALALDSTGRIYVGGDFTGGITTRDINNNSSALGSGMSGGVVASLTIDANNNVYAGGSFTSAGGVGFTNRIAKWTPVITTETICPPPPFPGAPPRPCYTVTTYDGSWSALGAGINYSVTGGWVTALETDDNGNLYAGGFFTLAGDVSASHIARWDGADWSALGTGMDNFVFSLLYAGGNDLYVGGDFTSAGGTPANRIAKLNLSDGTWTALTSISGDTTPPVITPNISGTAGNNGWYTSDVTVEWSVTDAESGIISQLGCETVTVNSDTAGTTFTCTATSEGGPATQEVTIKRDTAAPEVWFITPFNNASYSLNSIVNASYGCNDPAPSGDVGPSGISTCSGPVDSGSAIDTGTGGGHVFLVTATDIAGNTASSSVSYDVVADETPPVITHTINGTLGSNGWYIGDVTVEWSVTDPDSTVTSSVCDGGTLTTDSTGTEYTCQATSAGGTSSQSVTIKRDSTAPDVSVTAPVDGASYVLNSTINSNFSCNDVTSGIASCVGSVVSGSAIDTSTLGNKTFTATGTDSAGNTFTKTVNYTVTDTLPVITPTVTGTLGVNGWYISNVSVSWSVSDPESGIASSSGCGAVTVRKDTTGTTFTCTATNGVGISASQSFTVKKDTVAPSITVTTPKNKGTYAIGSNVNAQYTCTDATSGIASCDGTVSNGSAIDTSAGKKTFAVTSTDGAGNSTSKAVTYTAK